jgi:hypothetical protein
VMKPSNASRTHANAKIVTGRTKTFDSATREV